MTDRSGTKTAGGGHSLQGSRLLLLFPHLTAPGGAMNYTLRLAGFLAETGATVAILALCADPARFAAPAGVEIISMEGPLTSRLAYWASLPLWQRRINARIASWQPDVVIPQVFPANWWGWLYKRRHPDAKVVWICHEPSAFIHSLPWIAALVPFWKRWLARLLRPLLAAVDIRLCGQSDRIVANSAYTCRMVQGIYGRKADAIAHPGIDREIFSPGRGAEREGIITVARLTKFKRIDFLLRVFALVSREHPDLTFSIVGRGEEEGTLRALAGELGIGSRVIFHGSVDNETLARLYRKSLLFLHGSIDEPFGMAPLEAIACGTPVVAHRSGGPLEIVDESCGRLIDSLVEERWSKEVGAFITAVQGETEYFDRVSSSARRFAWETTLAPVLPVIDGLTQRSVRKYGV